MTELVVSDTTVWCNFAHAGQPRLVPAAYPGVASPQQVLDEIAEGQRLGHLGDFDGVQVSGTLGVLLHLVDMGAMSVTEADGSSWR